MGRRSCHGTEFNSGPSEMASNILPCPADVTRRQSRPSSSTKRVSRFFCARESTSGFCSVLPAFSVRSDYTALPWRYQQGARYAYPAAAEGNRDPTALQQESAVLQFPACRSSVSGRQIPECFQVATSQRGVLRLLIAARLPLHAIFLFLRDIIGRPTCSSAPDGGFCSRAEPMQAAWRSINGHNRRFMLWVRPPHPP